MYVGGRAATAVVDGPYAGAEATVDIIVGWPIYRLALYRAASFGSAQGDAAEAKALGELYDFYIAQARPAWNLEDPKGPVPATSAGLFRVPTDLTLRLYDLWVSTFPVPESTDAE